MNGIIHRKKKAAAAVLSLGLTFSLCFYSGYCDLLGLCCQVILCLSHGNGDHCGSCFFDGYGGVPIPHFF